MKQNFSTIVTMGDPSGIGPELLLKLFTEKPILIKNIIIFGDTLILEKLIKKFHLSLKLKNLPIIDAGIVKKFDDIFVPKIAGLAAFNYLEQAIAYMKEHKIKGIITLPVNKKNISLTNKNFDGHTSFFAQSFGVKNHVMFFYHTKQSCALYSEHIPIRDVAQSLQKNELIKKIKLIHHDYKIFFGTFPSIAMLGLNPHCGEEGLIGDEDTIISDTIKELKTINVEGPFPADGFFLDSRLRGNDRRKQFDVILGMYHDQILPPFKMTYGDRCVNITFGLPIVRTSVAHGTCSDIARTFTVNPINFYETIKLTKVLSAKTKNVTPLT